MVLKYAKSYDPEDWRMIEARHYTAEQRANIRSWGIAILEPPKKPVTRLAPGNTDGCQRCGHARSFHRGDGCSATVSDPGATTGRPCECGKLFELEKVFGVKLPGPGDW